jgi:K+-sensing histidine kinase KdpD
MCSILSKYINEDKGLKLLKTITNSSKHLTYLIEDALDISRIENGKFTINEEYFNIREAI